MRFIVQNKIKLIQKLDLLIKAMGSVTSVMSTVGDVITTAGEALLIGPAGLIIGNTATKITAQSYKRDINELLERIKPQVQKYNKLSKLVNELNMKSIQPQGISQDSNSLSDQHRKQFLNDIQILNKQGFQQLDSFFREIKKQRERLEELKKQGINQFKEQHVSGFIQWTQYILQQIQFIIQTVQFIMEPNLLDGIFLVLSMIQQMTSIINNIKDIIQLKQKKKQIEQYFQKGGKFQEEQKKLLKAASNIIKNCYLICLFCRQLFSQYYARVKLLSRDRVGGQTLNKYKQTIKVLGDNPFSLQFQKQLRKVYQINEELMQSEKNIQQKVLSIYRTLQIFNQKHNPVEKLIQMATLIKYLRSQDSFLSQINKRYRLFKQINDIRQSLIIQFKARQYSTLQRKKNNDIHIANKIRKSLQLTQQKEKMTAQIIAYFTTTFYADDSNGEHVYGYSLKQMKKYAEDLDWIDILDTNSIVLPEPKDKNEQWQAWNNTKNYLMQQYQSQKPKEKVIFKLMIMNFNLQKIQEIGTILHTYIGIKYELFKMPFEKIIHHEVYPSSQGKFQMVHLSANEFMKSQKSQINPMLFQKRVSDNLETLLYQVSLFVNCIIFPQRISKLKVYENQNSWEAIIQWTQEWQYNHQYAGKLLSGQILKINKDPSQELQNKLIFSKQQLKQEQIIIWYLK